MADVMHGHLADEDVEMLRKAFPPTEAAARFNGLFAES